MQVLVFFGWLLTVAVLTVLGHFAVWKLRDYLIARAQRTPYFHLPGYMLRWWLVPYGEVRERSVPWDGQPGNIWYATTTTTITTTTTTTRDGTGPVNLWRRPVARLLQKFGIAIRVHEILRSDLGRHPHNHPWWYLTIVLRGGYHEQRFDESGRLVSSKWHGPGSILFRRANSWHKLFVPLATTAHTLFITGSYKGTWGFNVDGKMVPHKEYKERA